MIIIKAVSNMSKACHLTIDKIIFSILRHIYKRSLYRVVFDNHLQISNIFSSNISFNFQMYINLMHALLEIKYLDKIMYTCKNQNSEVTTHKCVHHISFITTNQRPPN